MLGRVAAHGPGGGVGLRASPAGFDRVEHRAENLLRFGIGRGAGVVAVVLGEDLVGRQQHAVRLRRSRETLSRRRDARCPAASSGWRNSRACAGSRACQASPARRSPVAAVAGRYSGRFDDRRRAVQIVKRPIARQQLREPGHRLSGLGGALVGRDGVAAGKCCSIARRCGRALPANGAAATAITRLCSPAIRSAASSRPSAARIAIGISPVAG